MAKKISYLFLGEVPSVLITGPIAWAGLLFFFAMVVTALSLVPAMVVCRPCHVDIECELQPPPYGVILFHHVDARKRLCVHLHGKLTEDQSALLYCYLDL